MPDLDLTAITAARRSVAEHQERLRLLDVALAEASTARDAAFGAGDTSVAERENETLRRLVTERRDLLAREADARLRVGELADRLLEVGTPEDAVTSLSADHPVLLLPVRIETRFDGPERLRVRVFPDQVHVSTHDPALTEDEEKGLRWYWEHRWSHRGPDDPLAPDPLVDVLADEAWAVLSTRLRPGRAAFLVRTYPPVNLGTDDEGPRWDDLPRRAAAWSRAPQATLLPDRWAVVGFRREAEGRHRQIFRVWGSTVPDTLQVGPRPDPEAPATPRGLPADEGLRWVHDPDAAESVGMLVTVEQSDVVPGVRLADGVDRLVVLGVDRTLDPAQGAAALQAHLARLAGEGDLAFVPQGTATNSTASPGPGQDRAARSGFSSDPAAAREQLAPHRSAAPRPDDAATLTASALGLGGSVLAGVPGADLREQAWQGALVDALWPATAGYYLREMLDPLVDDERVEQALRDHAAAHLRPGGPLPTWRVADQPYGLLPVVPRSFAPGRGRRAQRDVLTVGGRLRGLVEELVALVPRIADVRTREDADDVLLRLLQRTPVAWSLDFRVLTGPAEFRYAGQKIGAIADLQHRVTATVLGTMGWYPTVPLTQLVHDPTSRGLDVPLVARPDVTDPTGYLAQLLDVMSQPDARRLVDGRTNSVVLLEAFLSYALVREYDLAAKQTARDAAPTLGVSPEFTAYLGRTADRVPFTLRVEPEVSVPAAPGSAVAVPSTPLELSSTVLPQLTGTATLGEHVATAFWRQASAFRDLLDVPDSPLHRLARYREAVTTLTQAPPGQLEWAFRGVLDLYATRLDAWFTSLAAARLQERRSSAPTGVHLGGWGVVEDLRRDTGPAADSAGFVHAPSLGQAVSLAVMRSARMAHRTGAGEVFDLDLTSRRVREALRLLEGIGSGQRLAALLGYRVERGLQQADLRLARWILPLRMQCPLRSERPDDPELVEPVESVAARDVVDGLALLARWERERTGLLTAAGVAAADHAAVATVLDAVAGLADAVSDVLVAEAVHQATAGNLERSGAALAAHDRQAPPPDPEFVRTPRDGAVVANRVGLWLPAEPDDPAGGWSADIRSVAEPRLDRWVGTVLGRPDRWRVTGTLDREPAVPLSVGVDAVSAGLGALSFALAARRPAGGRPTELELRAALALGRAAETGGHQPGPDDAVSVQAAGLAPVLDLAGWAADVAGARVLTPADLVASDDLSGGADNPPGRYDVTEAVARARAVRATAAGLVAALEAALAGGDADALADALLAVVPLDGPDAVSPAGDDDDATHAAAVLDRLRSRLAAADALLTGTDASAADPAAAEPPGSAEPRGLVAARAVVRTLLGADQPFLPLVLPAAPAPLAAALADRDALLNSDETAAVTWLHTRSLVRPALDPLASLLTHAEADGADVAADLRVVQAPHRPGARWVALPFERDERGVPVPPPHGAVALVLHAPQDVDPAQPAAGVVVDAWTETVPAASDTTAVAFQYDAPGARAPQTILLGLHPDAEARRWDFDALLGCVTEAVDLARLRTVGAAELAPLSTFLPALFLPDTYTRDVPGVRLRELAAAAQLAGVGGLLADHVLGKAGSTGA